MVAETQIDISALKLGFHNGAIEALKAIETALSETSPAAVTVNFGEDEQYFPPFSMMLLALGLKQLSSKYPDRLALTNTDANWLSYARTMGFFRLAGFKYGLPQEHGVGNNNYIPLVCLDVPDANIDNDDVHAEEVQRMQAIGDDLAARLLKTSEGEAFTALAYLCREILRNIVEHSYSDTMLYTAQFYPKNNKVEVVVADEGEGLIESLNQNPRLDIRTDQDAIKYALLPGVSGRAHKYAGRRARNHIYANSGYGLYLAQKICSDCGSFVLISNRAGIACYPDKQDVLSDVPFDGTMIRMIIEIDKIGNLDKRINHYRDLAQTIMASSSTLDKITPSAASMMLRL